MIVPAYWPVVEGVQEVEKSGSLVLEWKVMTPIEWADEEDMSSMCADEDDSDEVDECWVKSDMAATSSRPLSLCRERRK